MSLMIALGIAWLAADIADTVQAELKKFEGEWRIEKIVTADGEQTPDAMPEQLLTFVGKTWSFGNILAGEITSLDPRAMPSLIDMIGRPKNNADNKQEPILIEGIYRLDGDQLLLHVHVGSDRNRPTNFDKPTAANTALLTLKRVKSN
jgi:uncharacterized protein (TIGR03067 family)